MFIYRPDKMLYILCLFFLCLILLNGCGSSPTSDKIVTPSPSVDVTATTQPCGLSSCPDTATTPDGLPFADTWSDVHLFQSFTFHLNQPKLIADVAKYNDFIWGVEPYKVAAFRAENPQALLGYYIPLNRDHGSFDDEDLGRQHDLAYWQAFHPDWVLYKCDRVTPVKLFHDPNISLDMTNPDVINWQIQTYALPASTTGYDVLSVDNLNLENLFGACGFYRNGQWVQRYTGALNDQQYRLDLLGWITAMQKAIRALPRPLALIANIGYGPNAPSLKDPILRQIVDHLDGVLDEKGFTDYGAGYTTNESWTQTVQFIQDIQQLDKPYYIVDEFGTSVLNNDEIQWGLASYLMCKDHMASLFMSRIQDYGSDLRREEYGAHIGTPQGNMYSAQNVYWRNYSNGKVIVNASNVYDHTITLDASTYIDIYGNHVSQTITLPPHSGLILLSQ